MNKDIAKGKVKQAKGNIKEKVGKVTGDKSQLEIPKICPSCHNPVGIKRREIPNNNLVKY